MSELRSINMKPKTQGLFANLFKLRQQYDGEKVIKRYEESLKSSWLISSSFDQIVSGNLDQKRKTRQLVIVLAFVVMLPRYFFCIFLYLQPDNIRENYQYVLVDFMETLGLVGRSLNAIYCMSLFPVVIDKVIIRCWESSGTLDYITDMNSLKTKGKKSVDNLSNTERYQFLSMMHKKLFVLKYGVPMVTFPIHIFQTMGCILFLMRVSQSIIISLWALIFLLAILWLQHLGVVHIFTLILSFHVTTDYFAARIKSLKRRLMKLSQKLTESKLSKCLNLYHTLVFDIRKRNHNLRILISHMLYFYCPMLALVLFLFTIEMVWWMQFIILTAASTFSIAVTSTELYVGHLQSRVHGLYSALNTALGKGAFGSHEVTFKTRMHLKTAIKEVGSQFTEGQFMVGLTNGRGAAVTTMTALELTGMTIQFTILLIMNIYYS
jgi:hypothetical protein